MSIIDQLVSLIALHECLGCNQEGSLLCKDCLQRMPTLPTCCFYCKRSTMRYQICMDCRRVSYLDEVLIATAYTDIAKELVRCLKFSGAQSAARPMAHAMLRLLDEPVSALIIPVPTASSRVRQRGYDQATLLAKALARYSGSRSTTLLRRSGQTHQVGASRDQRLHQLVNAFYTPCPARVIGKHVLLVDDIITTGATFEAAARVLRLSGAASVSAIAFAHPIK